MGIENGFQGKEGQKLPEMSDEFVELVSQRYIELYRKITGKPFIKSEVNDKASIESAIQNFFITK